MKLQLATPGIVRMAATVFAVLLIVHSISTVVLAGGDAPDEIVTSFEEEVDMRLDVPTAERVQYAQRLVNTLAGAGLRGLSPQYFLLVDRSPRVQAAFIYFYSPPDGWRFIGASPVSTGQPGGVEHFVTPLGLFPHTLANPDFRAEGTLNKNGIRGYGLRGMRVFDFGWVQAQRTWGARGPGLMRLQVHATDPDRLEGQLGRPRSKGCIRIPASLNVFIDRHGILDADYEKQAKSGRRLWVLRVDRVPVSWPGQYLVIVDSERRERPAWSPWPPRRNRIPASPKLVMPKDGRGEAVVMENC